MDLILYSGLPFESFNGRKVEKGNKYAVVIHIEKD